MFYAALAWLRRARKWTWAALVVAGGVALLLLRGWWKRQGRAERDREALEDAVERRQRGREAVQDGRDSGLAPDERLRRNDGRW